MMGPARKATPSVVVFDGIAQAGGSDYPMEILKKAGIDVSEAVRLCMQEFADALRQFEALEA